MEIRAGEGFQVLQVRFLPGKGTIAGCGLTAEGKGAVRIFDLASGKQVFQIENPEPVIHMDFDRSGRYLILTGMSQIKVWDMVENQAVSIFPKDSAGIERGFFHGGPLSSFSPTPFRYMTGRTEKRQPVWRPWAPTGPVKAKKINDNLFAWVSREGLHTCEFPRRKKGIHSLSIPRGYTLSIWRLTGNGDCY